MKIGYKLTSIFLIFTLSITMLFYLFGMWNQNNNLERIALEHIMEDKASFNNLQARDTNMLFSTLEMIVQDPGLKAVYLEKNRKKLYSYGHLLFQNLKNKYGITHFYFILPDGRVFLRMHNEEIYGDLVERHSFQKARDTGSPAREFELGKTAFALRAVMPYYQAGKLIGYVELAEEINHFLEILRSETNSEFGIIADKKYLDGDDWKSVRKVVGLRNNWDDLEKHLILSRTSDGEIAAQCFVEDNLERVEEGENILQQIQGQNVTFMCGGFDLNDAEGRHIGAVLSLTDISKHVAAAQKTNNVLLRIAIIFFFLTFTVGILISRSITKPIMKLIDVSKAIGSGDLEQKVSVSSTDELGQLSITFNEMIEKRKLSEAELKNHREELAKLVDKRTHELQNVNETLKREIAERKLAETEAIRASHLAALGELAAGVAHEINNPINGIINYAEIISRKSTQGSMEKDVTSRIIKEGDRIANIVRSLLSFARDSKEEKKTVHVYTIISEALTLTKTQMRKDGINIKVNISDDLPPIIAQPQQIGQVFLNIISNARYALNEKYNGEHNDKILEIQCSSILIDSAPYIRTTFYDQGIGIPANIMDKIMNPFFSTKAGNVGTGLGLSISHGIVSDHNGKMVFDSAEGEFTKVSIDLPAQNQDK